MNGIASVILAAAGFAGDRVSKNAAEKKLADGDREYLGGKLRFMLRKNKGFFMGHFGSRRRLVVVLSSIVFVLALLVYIPVITDEGCRAFRPGFSLLFAGAAGNVYDRLVKGEVTDFVNVSFLKKIVFNLADVLIVAGCLVTLLEEMING